MAESDPLVFVMKDVLEGATVLTVYHETDGDWQYLTADDATPDNARLVHQSHVLDLDASLRPLLSMPLGTWATRLSADEPWHYGQEDE